MAEIFYQTVEIGNILEVPKESWNGKREQYLADLILNSIPKPEPGNRYLGVLDLDIYAFGLNFVFGEADSIAKKALISTAKLKPEFYGLPPDENLLFERTLKEAVHEIGHTCSLRHCPNRCCVMHYSNSLSDTDIKEWKFCAICRGRLNLNMEAHYP
jgi:archaemetzincin